MKIIFLDVDGVLNKIGKPSESTYFVTGKHIDTEIIENFNNLLDKIDIHIVISSSWRSDMDDLYEVLKESGFKHLGKIIGYTELNSNYRGNQIKNYLSDNDIEHYLVIDDCIGDICGDVKIIPENFVLKSNPKTGLTKEDLEFIEKYFK
jgi:hypothetical protein